MKANAFKRLKRPFPDRDLKFPESGNFSSGPDKSGIGKPELAIPTGEVPPRVLEIHISHGAGAAPTKNKKKTLALFYAY